jgi:hypothetical protein
MDKWQDTFSVFIPVTTLMIVFDLFRNLLAYKIERKLGRKLTDLEWQYFLQENNRKAEVEAGQAIFRQWKQQLTDRQVIHDFVWQG